MAIGNLSGCELNSLGEFLASSGTVSVQNTIKRTGGYALRANPTTTNVGYAELDVRVAVSAPASMYSRFYFRYDTAPSSGNSEPIFATQSAGSVLKFELRVTNSSGSIFLAAYNSAVTLLATGTTALSSGVWYRIEVLTGTGASANWEVRIDGTTEISGTDDLTTNNNAKALLGKTVNRSGQGVDFFYDDMLLDNGAWPGAGQIKSLLPDADGDNAQWTAGTGSTYTEVDEGVAADGATTYWQSVAQNDAHTVNLQSTATGDISGTINALKVSAHTARAGGANGNMSLRIRSGTSNTDGGTSTTIASFGWRHHWVSATDPATSAAWTLSGIDEAEVGVVDVHASQRSRCSTLMAQVDYAPSAVTDNWFPLTARHRAQLANLRR